MANMFIRRSKKADVLDELRTWLNTLKLVLFKSPATPDETTPTASYTFLPTPSEYTPVTGLGFSTPFLNGGNKGETDAPRVIFTLNHASSDYTIYGWALVDPADADNVVFAQVAASPFTVTAAGQLYAVDPAIQLDAL